MNEISWDHTKPREIPYHVTDVKIPWNLVSFAAALKCSICLLSCAADIMGKMSNIEKDISFDKTCQRRYFPMFYLMDLILNLITIVSIREEVVIKTKWRTSLVLECKVPLKSDSPRLYNINNAITTIKIWQMNDRNHISLYQSCNSLECNVE